MKTILLYGSLGKKFGKKFVLDVKDPAEAIRALMVICKGFKKYLVDDKDSGYKIFVGSEDLYISDLHNPTSDRDFIRIVPIVSGYGRDSGGTTRIIIGIIIIAIAAWATGGSSLSEPSQYAALWGVVAQIGWNLVISGVISIILESMIEENERPEDNPNYAFDGVVNTTRQGNAVPVGYGILRVGSQVISAGIETV